MDSRKITEILLRHGHGENKTVGLVGCGRFGNMVRQCAEKLGMKVLLCDPPRAEQDSGDVYDAFQPQWGNGMGGCSYSDTETDIFLPLSAVLSRSDLISVQVPLTENGTHPTRNLIDGAFLRKCRPGAPVLCFSDLRTVAPSVRRHPNLFFPEATLSDFQCKRCGNCCKWEGPVRVSEQEIEQIAVFLKIPVPEFIERNTVLAPDRKSLSLTEKKDGSCFYYDEENRSCRINPVKPEQCSAFPFRWNFPGWESLCEGGKALFRKE